MKRRISLLLILAPALIAPAAPVGARDIFSEDLSAGITGLEAAAAPASVSSVVNALAAKPPSAVEREWLVLVYLNGRNDLAQAAIADVNELEMVGSTDKVAVTAELGLLNDRGNSVRYYIRKDTTAGALNRTGAIVSPRVDVPGADMGSWKHFADFAKWSYKNYPARKVLVVLWGHGSGRLDSGADNTGSELGIAYDDLTRNFIRNRQLGMALKEIELGIGKKIDVYASDSCLMQMASVVYEIKDSAELIVGSEERIPGAGFPYNDILSTLLADPGISPEALSSAMVNDFAAYYDTNQDNVTLSSIRAAALPEFVRLLNDWVRAAAVPEHREKILQAGEEALSFEYRYNGNDNSFKARSKDLYDLVDAAGKKTDDGSALRAKGDVLKSFITEKLVVSNNISWFDDAYDRAKGVAVYFPKLIYDPSYDENMFSRDSLWDDFLKWKLDASYGIK